MKPQPPVTKMRIASRTSSGRKRARADFSSPSPDVAQTILNALESDWMFWGILGLAAALRILFLGIKPPHFDEGINGWFVDQDRSNHPQCAGKRLDVLGHSRFGRSLTYPFPRNKATAFRRGNQWLVRRSNGQGWILS